MPAVNLAWVAALTLPAAETDILAHTSIGEKTMKTLILTLMLAVTAVSGVVATSQSAFAGGKGGAGGSIDPCFTCSGN